MVQRSRMSLRGTRQRSCPHQFTKQQSPKARGMEFANRDTGSSRVKRGTLLWPGCTGSSLTDQSPSWCIMNASAEQKRFPCKPPCFFHVSWERLGCSGTQAADGAFSGDGHCPIVGCTDLRATALPLRKLRAALLPSRQVKAITGHFS